jgi:dephospho-CoA kinase
VGLVGPLASGKSVVAGELAELGAVVFTADEVNRELLAPGQPLLERVLEAFGPGYLREDGGLDRAALGRRIFEDESSRTALESIVHVAMRDELARRVAQARAAGAPVIVVEAAVLHAMGAADLADHVVKVTAAREERLRRLVERDGFSAEEAERRLAVHEKLGLDDVPADYVIDTTAGLEATREQVRELWAKLQSRG